MMKEIHLWGELSQVITITVNHPQWADIVQFLTVYEGVLVQLRFKSLMISVFKSLVLSTPYSYITYIIMSISLI